MALDRWDAARRALAVVDSVADQEDVGRDSVVSVLEGLREDIVARLRRKAADEALERLR